MAIGRSSKCILQNLQVRRMPAFAFVKSMREHRPDYGRSQALGICQISTNPPFFDGFFSQYVLPRAATRSSDSLFQAVNESNSHCQSLPNAKTHRASSPKHSIF
jgi:hypothetical protein